jgi:cytochrome c553
MDDQAKRRGILTGGTAIAGAALAAPTVAASAQAAALTSPKPRQGETQMKTLQVRARNLTAIGLLTLLSVASVHAQTGPVLSANVPFAFEVGGKTLPAGTYQFKLLLSERSVVVSSGRAVVGRVPIMTQLAGASIFRDTGLVFDTFEGRHVLSEIWIPGEDGVLLNITTKQHSHERVIAVVSGAAPNLSGKAIFEHTCARCHGPNGKGNPAADKFFQTPVPRLDSAYVQAKSDEELKDIISHGRRKMDPVRMGQATVQHLLDPESVDAVIGYVRTFKQ